ncbi:MAG TPA: FAD-dependent oxidoreductase [Longimicrobiaceae bacterium]|nr:FAD-dependent oxidoreductase [Longimicrobiaceae bacterium]
MQRIGIIGAGLSGLVTAKTFLEDGHAVTLFETESEVGGVWARSRRYPGLTTQNPRDTYAFSDFPFPRSYPEWPTGEQVQAYLAAYADRFAVTERIRFGTRVDAVLPRPGGRPGWMVRATRIDGPDAGRPETHEFDRVVVCTGVFSAPHLPDLPGADDFRAAGGEVLHSTGFNHPAQVRGRRVVVVGFAKSATDVSMAALEHARACTLVFRRAHWKSPRFWFGRVNLKYILCTRFAEALLRYRRVEGFERVLHTVGRPLVWAFWRGITGVLRATFGLRRAGMVPDEPIETGISCLLSLETPGFYQAVHSGRLQTRRGSVRRFVAGGVELESGERVEADAVVFGTGFRQDVPFLPEAARSRVVDEQGIVHLYRNLLHPDVPRLGFVGYNSSLYSQLTSEVGARWLAEHVRGELALPPREAMLREMAAWWEWLRTARPVGLASGTCVIPFSLHYVEELLRDLGARRWRSRNRLREYLMPVDPTLYADLKRELDARRARRRPPREAPAVAAEVAAGGD